MSEDILKQFDEDFSLFIEMGLIAIKQLDEVSARRLFKAAEVLNPESTAPMVGVGYIALNKLEVDKGIEIFTEVLEKEPDHHLAQTFLGMCYSLKKTTRDKGEKMINDAKNKTDDPVVQNLGDVALSWIEKDLRKKSPLFSQGVKEKKKE
jgi:lipopolysaccharide biosynthesis regulator YciM